MTVFYEDTNYVVRVLDKLNIVVEEKSVVQKGKTAGQERRTVLGYYSTLGPALKKLLDVLVINGEATNGLPTQLLRTYEEITSKLQGVQRNDI